MARPWGDEIKWSMYLARLLLRWPFCHPESLHMTYARLVLRGSFVAHLNGGLERTVHAYLESVLAPGRASLAHLTAGYGDAFPPEDIFELGYLLQSPPVASGCVAMSMSWPCTSDRRSLKTAMHRSERGRSTSVISPALPKDAEVNTPRPEAIVKVRGVGMRTPTQE